MAMEDPIDYTRHLSAANEELHEEWRRTDEHEQRQQWEESKDVLWSRLLGLAFEVLENAKVDGISAPTVAHLCGYADGVIEAARLVRMSL